VDQPARALAEVKRVLRPGGALRFIEHVRAEGLMGRVHDAATPLWRHVAAGCRLNRRTGETIQAAGFGVKQLERTQLLPGVPLLAGVAHRQ